MIKWGILGAGNIAKRFAESLAHFDDCQLAAISGRNYDKLKAFADTYPCEKLYVGHDLLLEDPDVDAIYLALPHGMHHEWAIKAMKAGKAVLCEKPAAMSETEMREIAAVSKEENVLFMEAMKSRFEPAYTELKNRLEAGAIGTLQQIDTKICFAIPKEAYGKSYHTLPKQGGALLDSGTYCASLLEDMLKGEPHILQTYATYYNEIDLYADASMQFDNGIGRIEVGLDRSAPRNAVITGTEGSIEVIDLHRPSTFVIHRAGSADETVTVPYDTDDFHAEIAHFNELLKNGMTESPIMPLAASVRCAHILDVIKESYTVYDAEDLKVLEEQEEILQYESFTNADALKLGNRLAQTALEYDLPVAIRIQNEDDLVVFQYMMDGKSQKNEFYMNGKRACVLDTGHSSAWADVQHQIDDTFDQWYTDGIHVVSGGAFPIRVNGERKAVVMVSGLHEGKDHELLVKALAAELNKEVPPFRKGIR